MSKNSRKKRRQKNRAPKHDFVASMKKPTTPDNSIIVNEKSKEKFSVESPAPNNTYQKKDIVKTLVIAAIIIGLFFIISIADKKNQLLNEAGNYTLNLINLNL